MKSLSVPHHPTSEALLQCLSCRQVPAPLRSLPASLCAFCLLSHNFSWTHPALWNLQADFMQLFSGETQYFLCPVGPHNPWRSKMSMFFSPPFLILTASVMHSTNPTSWRQIKHFFPSAAPSENLSGNRWGFAFGWWSGRGRWIGLMHMKAWIGARMRG